MAKIVSFSLDKESLDLLERSSQIASFRNRSDMIRAALHLLLNEFNEMEKLKGHISAIVVVTHQEKNEGDISKIKHQFSEVISTQIHSNLHEMCMETFVLHGNAEPIKEFVKKMKESKAAIYAKLIVVGDCR